MTNIKNHAVQQPIISTKNNENTEVFIADKSINNGQNKVSHPDESEFEMTRGFTRLNQTFP